MITFEGIVMIDNNPIICFANESGAKVSIPIDHRTADRIGKYLSRISPPFLTVDRGEIQSDELE